MTAIELHSGRFLDLSNPDPADICLDDIAHGLSNLCRFTGQTDRFYSVAEHAVLVSERLYQQGASFEVQLAGLHHDDSEAFLGDVSSPLKLLIPEYGRLERVMTRRVHLALGLSQDVSLDPAIKDADLWALAAEAYCYLPSQGGPWADDFGFEFDWDNPMPMGLSPDVARKAYLARHGMLCNALQMNASQDPLHR